MLTIIAVAASGLLAVFLIRAALKPDTFEVLRALDITAPPQAVYDAISDFKKWREWSPWERLDPALKRTYGGADNGQGAVYAWEGNGKAGAGRMEIVETIHASHVKLNLDFFRPFKASNIVEFTLTEQNGGTRVTWHMHGPLNYMAKIIHGVFNMDKLVGRDFESGLSNLKSLTERKA
jgi:uncharacterized protein YndB with AHSA1/START domain